MSHKAWLDRISRRIRTRLTKSRRARTESSVRSDSLIADLRRAARNNPHVRDRMTAMLIYGIVLGHALGTGEITEQELVDLTRTPE